MTGTGLGVFLGSVGLVLLGLSGCGGKGTTVSGSGATGADGGSGAEGGDAATGGRTTGGANANGGATSGGTSAAGAPPGGASVAGALPGGAAAGGAATGGVAQAGAPQAGAATGGVMAGGAMTGGATTGGAAPGGAPAGGAAVAGSAGASSCGDGMTSGGEQCDHGNANDDQRSGDCASVCRTDCRCPYCGDGVADFAAGEECDDGNTAGGDGCSSTCAIEASPTCGDDVIDVGSGEECDDGNTTDGDGCSASCQLEPVGASCGDSNPDSGEKCDPPDAMPADGDGCNATCNLLGQVTTLEPGLAGGSLASDNSSLWIGRAGGPCTLSQLDIDDCLNNGNCTPTVVAGGACGTPADGNATSATFNGLGSMTTDGVTVWIGDQNTIRAYDIASGDVTTVAGQAGSCAAVDGNGTTDAYFHDVRGLTYFGGLVYVLDGCENVLRTFDPATGDVMTIAGTRTPDPTVTQSPPYTCQAGFTCVSNPPVAGFGTAANFGSPRYMTADNAGNLYITDTNGQAIFRYNTVTTWAEVMVSGSSGGVPNLYTDGDAASTTIGRPRALVSDGTSLYFAEQVHDTIRQLVISTVTTSTVAGTMNCDGGQDGLGADTTQDWSTGSADTCAGNAPGGVPQLDTPLGAFTYHFRTQSIFFIDGNGLRRLE
jgi:cysteine-rich repeat protein